ncbi:hypothetical protein YTPLAS18_40530 [Nitrospira sp.]|nr:hypothetical protein YTPLAS18_40530 [Nitrospira sp.]
MGRAIGARWDGNMNCLGDSPGVIWNTGLVTSAMPVANAMRGEAGLGSPAYRTGGSLFSLAVRHRQRQHQVFRIDYHGAHGKGRDADATYFQVGPRMSHLGHDPWFHYHLPTRD